MKLIAERLGRTDKLDRLRCIRCDGSETSTAMPRQGILPHDLVHFVAESGLGWRHGFLDDTMFLDGVRSACEARGRSVPALPPVAGAALFEQALALNARWQRLPFHGSLELELTSTAGAQCGPP